MARDLPSGRAVETAEDKTRRVQSLAKIMQLVHILETVPDYSFGELVAAAGLPRGSVRRFLLSLIEAGLVTQDPSSRRYRLSLRWLTIGAHALEHLAYPQVARPFLERLRDATNLTSHLSVLEGRETVFVAKVEPREPIRLYTNVGMRAWAPCTASGKALLASLAPTEVLTRLGAPPWPTFTARTITSPAALREELARIREQGYAVDDEEHRQGIRCVAAPVASAQGYAVAAVSVSGLTTQIHPGIYAELGRAVRQTARELARHLGLG